MSYRASRTRHALNLSSSFVFPHLPCNSIPTLPTFLVPSFTRVLSAKKPTLINYIRNKQTRKERADRPTEFKERKKAAHLPLSFLDRQAEQSGLVVAAIPTLKLESIPCFSYFL